MNLTTSALGFALAAEDMPPDMGSADWAAGSGAEPPRGARSAGDEDVGGCVKAGRPANSAAAASSSSAGAAVRPAGRAAACGRRMTAVSMSEPCVLRGGGAGLRGG
eukprot:CAMPEP_0204600278 /NCGR_PEP_ID=MMETSP0661-20131031/55342_1 /ASSEMBLY_ACC=CAM_ASM_000606 /TAXON_ID=109239 /ORGANISM="Alexandrium margalefi, Strain AMGDE01CS-322" /LENGTH=105 /DNA_ID=CAMNT_0051611071 /DNA_START=416 /DNA_END=730 /DNA_ORIENTATION=-